jgi:hypothetical protein
MTGLIAIIGNAPVSPTKLNQGIVTAARTSFSTQSAHPGDIDIQSTRLRLREERQRLGGARPSQFDPKQASNVVGAESLKIRDKSFIQSRMSNRSLVGSGPRIGRAGETLSRFTPGRQVLHRI